VINSNDEGVKKVNCVQRFFGFCIRGEKVFKECLEKAFFQTQFGRYLERLNGILMLGSAIFYVILSYLAG